MFWTKLIFGRLCYQRGNRVLTKNEKILFIGKEHAQRERYPLHMQYANKTRRDRPEALIGVPRNTVHKGGECIVHFAAFIIILLLCTRTPNTHSKHTPTPHSMFVNSNQEGMYTNHYTNGILNLPNK